MSTYYAVICDQHRESVSAVSWGGGGVNGMDRENVLPRFLLGHRRCTLRIVDEHQHEYSEYTSWEAENADDLLDAALDRTIEENLKGAV